MAIITKEVTSTNIKKLVYDEGLEELEVSFVKGGVYKYHGVPIEIFNLVANAGSVGKAFHRYIRPKQFDYKFKKVG